jgi:hypothetical protein
MWLLRLTIIVGTLYFAYGFIMKLIIHDLSEQFLHVLPESNDRLTIFSAVPAVKPCLGCFGCWIKSPGKCVIKDRGQQAVSLLANHSEVVFISRLIFGCLSPDIKSVLDRSIGFLLPFFKVRGGKMRHKFRYTHRLIFKYLFYDSKGRDFEMDVAKRLIADNSNNLPIKEFHIGFFDTPNDLKNAI